MRTLALLALCTLANTVAAESISINFDNIPAGTLATKIELPGLRFWEDVNPFVGGARSGCHWVVTDLATLVQKTTVPGVDAALPRHASGHVLACVSEHQPCDPISVCDGGLISPELYIESSTYLPSATAVIGGLGCLHDAGYGSPIIQAECGMNVRLGMNDPSFTRDDTFSFSLENVPGLDVDAVGSLAASNHTWLAFWGEGTVGSHRAAATTALFIDDVSITRHSPADDCPAPDVVRFEPPFDQMNHIIEAAAGETIRVTWKPYSFPVNVYYRGFAAYLFPVPTGFQYLGDVILPESATTADISIPHKYLGDYTARLNVQPSGGCGGTSWWPVPSNFGPLLEVHDPPPPLRIDSIAPRIATPGTIISIRGDGFVGVPRVTIGAKSAIAVVVDINTLSVTVPQLDDGPAEVTVTTAYGSISVPASSGRFTVGLPPPRQRAVRR